MVIHMLPVDRTRWPELDPLEIYADAPVPPDPGAAALRAVSAALTSTRAGEPIRLAEIQAALPDLAGEFPTLAFVGGGFALIWSDELSAGLELADAALAYSRTTGSPTGAAQWSTARASALLRLGRVREAVAEATASVEFNIDQAPSTLAWPLVPLIDGLILLGDLDGAERAAALQPLRPSGYLSVAMLTETLGRLALAEEEPDKAARLLAEAGERLTGMGYAGPPLSAWRGCQALALAQLGDPDAGADLAREEIALAETADAARVRGVAQLALALCSPEHARSESIVRAVDTLRSSPARIELCLALIELGIELRRRGEAVDAREPLSEAVEIANACGAAALEERARAELVASGARPRRRALSGVEALTPSELRVAILVAEGRTNREVAEALFLSEKTVEGHLRGVFRKLGIGSRTEVADHLSGMAERERSEVEG
jgi:DNA-binding NarL/FixJ family response regulator